MRSAFDRVLLIAYFDSSALVKRYVRESGSERVLTLLEEATPATSRFSSIEIASAFARRCREGRLNYSLRRRMLRDLDADLDSFYLVELVPEVVLSARDLLGRSRLRAADALQLASSIVLQRRVRSPVLFIAFDRDLNEAARGEGIGVPGIGVRGA